MLWQARPICLTLFWHLVRAAASRTFCTAGSSRPISTAMIAITTSSSISVKPRRRGGGECLMRTLRGGGPGDESGRTGAILPARSGGPQSISAPMSSLFFDHAVQHGGPVEQGVLRLAQLLGRPRERQQPHDAVVAQPPQPVVEAGQ